MTPPTIKDKNVTYANSSRELRIVRKYVIELIPVKSYKKGLVFIVAKTIKDISSLKLVKLFSQ